MTLTCSWLPCCRPAPSTEPPELPLLACPLSLCPVVAAGEGATAAGAQRRAATGPSPGAEARISAVTYWPMAGTLKDRIRASRLLDAVDPCGVCLGRVSAVSAFVPIAVGRGWRLGVCREIDTGASVADTAA